MFTLVFAIKKEKNLLHQERFSSVCSLFFK